MNGLVLNTDIHAQKIQNNLNLVEIKKNRAMQKLSSGQRINSAQDDSAGLAVSMRAEAQSRGLVVASRNINDAVSMISVADGALSTMSDVFQRVRELILQSANDDLSTEQRKMLKTEYDSIINYARNDIALNTQFNDMKLLYANTTKHFQVGANSSDTIDITFDRAVNYYIPYDITILSSPIGLHKVWVKTILNKLDEGIQKINDKRAYFGAKLNELNFLNQNLQVENENIQSMKSRVLDADYSVETSNLAKQSILEQTGIAMLVHTKEQKQIIIDLLKSNEQFR